mgnify:CR=1 FL=1
MITDTLKAIQDLAREGSNSEHGFAKQEALKAIERLCQAILKHAADVHGYQKQDEH